MQKSVLTESRRCIRLPNTRPIGRGMICLGRKWLDSEENLRSRIAQGHQYHRTLPLDRLGIQCLLYSTSGRIGSLLFIIHRL